MLLNGLPLDALTAAVAPHGVRAEVARRLFAHVHALGGDEKLELRDVRGMPHAAAASLEAAGARIGRLEIVSRKRSPADGFVKYLLQLHDGKVVEAVLIPLPAGPDTTPEKYTMCVSSQAGCALACVFCATGRLGFLRNLEAWEIVEQVSRIRDEVQRPIRGVVFMGQGEPFLN